VVGTGGTVAKQDLCYKNLGGSQGISGQTFIIALGRHRGLKITN
jgi:hypothetical protein